MKKIICLLYLALTAVVVMGGEALFDNGSTCWKIHLSSKAGKVEKYAAKELQCTLKKISGVDFPIVKNDQIPKQNAILLGTIDSSPAIKNVAKNLNLKKSNIEKLAIYTLDGNLYLAGNNPRACLYAVYSFLQNYLGVRWFWPGKDGEFISKKKSYVLPQLAWNYQPSFRYREMTPCSMHYHVPTEIWMARNFLNGGSRTHKIRDKAGFYRINGGHSVSIDKKEFTKHPKWFSLINGKRTQEGRAGCWSNPGFFDYIVKKHVKLIEKLNADILNIFPADILLRCECAECVKNPDRTLRWFNFYAKLQKILKKKYPNLLFGGIAYQEYRCPPSQAIKGLEYIEYCQYNRCYIHKFDNPNCKLNKNSLAELKQWQAKANMGIYGYEFDIFEPNMYVPFWNMLADEIKVFRDMGIVRMKTEMSVRYPKKALREELVSQKLRLPYYIYSRLLWNPDVKVDDLLSDWCRIVYGPAADSMFAYHKGMADAWDKLKIHRSYFGCNPMGTARFFITPKLIKFAEGCFSKAYKSISGIDNTKQIRIKADLDLNKKLFLQWKKLYQISKKNTVSISLPLLKNKNKFAKAVKLPITSKGNKHKTTKAYMYWTSGSLHLRVICYDQKMSELKKGKNGHDINLWNDDNLEIFLDCADGELYRHLAVNPAGGYYDAKGNDKNWNPKWQVKTELGTNFWKADIKIPFVSLGAVPKAGDQWLMVLNRNSAPEVCGFPRPSYHDPSSGAVICFSDKAMPERKITWIVPDGVSIAKFFPALLKNGWNFNVIEGSQAINADLKDCKLIVVTTHDLIKGKSYWFKNNADFYRQKIVPAVKNGAVVLINNYGKLSRFEDFFNNESFKLKFSEKLNPLRKTIHITKSSFASKPEDMSKVLCRTPPGVYIPKRPDKWEFLATQYMKDGTEMPYLLAQPYGKGMVVVSGLIDYAKAPSKVVLLFNNLLEYNNDIYREKFDKVNPTVSKLGN